MRILPSRHLSSGLRPPQLANHHGYIRRATPFEYNVGSGPSNNLIQNPVYPKSIEALPNERSDREPAPAPTAAAPTPVPVTVAAAAAPAPATAAAPAEAVEVILPIPPAHLRVTDRVAVIDALRQLHDLVPVQHYYQAFGFTEHLLRCGVRPRDLAVVISRIHESGRDIKSTLRASLPLFHAVLEDTAETDKTYTRDQALAFAIDNLDVLVSSQDENRLPRLMASLGLSGVAVEGQWIPQGVSNPEIYARVSMVRTYAPRLAPDYQWALLSLPLDRLLDVLAVTRAIQRLSLLTTTATASASAMNSFELAMDAAGAASAAGGAGGPRTARSYLEDVVLEPREILEVLMNTPMGGFGCGSDSTQSPRGSTLLDHVDVVHVEEARAKLVSEVPRWKHIFRACGMVRQFGYYLDYP